VKVAVVGAGIMGLGSAWALARAGHRVTVYEQGPVPNPRGASIDQHRLIRHAYGNRVGYMRMVVEAYQAWDQLWSDLGEKLYAPTGTLVLDSTTQGWARQTAEALSGLGLTLEQLEPGKLERRFPLIASEGVAEALYVGTGGALLAHRIVAALARHLTGRGVEILPGTRVVALDPARPSLVLEGGQVVEADVLVVAAGAWVTRLLPALASRLVPSRQVVVYLEPPAALASGWLASPMVLDIGPESGFYLVPPVFGTELKIGDHRFTRSGDPDGPREAGESEIRAVVELCRARLRGFARYRVSGAKVCFYTVEEDERFVLEPQGAAWILSACSGHGFKFGPLLGLRLAEVITKGGDAGALTRWAAGEARSAAG
jgi:glycine/D-amino acid oxidase-like deaminating enzyme